MVVLQIFLILNHCFTEFLPIVRAVISYKSKPESIIYIECDEKSWGEEHDIGTFHDIHRGNLTVNEPNDCSLKPTVLCVADGCQCGTVEV